MTEKDIKPMPKYIIKAIQKLDKKNKPDINGKIRFYSYLAIWKKELVKVTVAVKNKYSKWYCKQVAIHGLDSDLCLVKDLEYCGYVGYGYRVGWYSEGLQKYKNWFESDFWYSAEDKYYDPFAPVVNLDLLNKLPEFKYSCFKDYDSSNILKFLRLYRKYPNIEYFMKLGLKNIVDSKVILKLANKDKNFCKWLVKNKVSFLYPHYKTSIIAAYKNNTTVDYEDKKAKIVHEYKQGNYRRFQEHYFYDFNQLVEYVLKQNISMSTYIDYFNACEYLGLDLGQEKNRLPHNFKHWHDIRIDEYHTQKAIADEQKRKELFTQFSDIASKYLSLQHNKKYNFIAIIPQSPNDLIHEGESLHHCVGKMNYDQKFIREESLIFFIRSKLNPNTPLVTLEYSLQTNTILQCYGDHDSKPNDDILHYVNKIWLPYANKTLKKLSA